MLTQFHFFIQSFTLHFLLKNLKGLVDIVPDNVNGYFADAEGSDRSSENFNVIQILENKKRDLERPDTAQGDENEDLDGNFMKNVRFECT